MGNILTARLRKEELIAFIEKHPDQFEEVINISLTDEQPQAWRAAWLLNHCMKKNDPRLQAHIKKIIKIIPTKQDGHQRELLKVLNKMELSEKYDGLLFDVCMTIWEAIHKSPSVRGTAFVFLLKIIKKYPELRNEIEHLTQSHYTDTLSPGIKHSFNRIVKELNFS
ncbi:MAG: hypothetical protein IMF12_07470 [Proteobacteria bacterium]|nr:hypothetical protein [Pseudomonadota bacterium]